MYKAVGSRGSRVSRVLWMLEELEQSYEFVEVGLRSPEAYALNPSGKVPILIDDDLRITDSAAICVYLADKHAGKGMGANPGLAGRAEMDSWMHFAQSEFEAPLWNKLRHRFLLPKEVRVDVGPAAAHDFASEVKALDRRLGEKPFALGDRFSAVDVLLDRSVITVDPETYAAFVERLDAPPEANERLRRTMTTVPPWSKG